MKTIKRSGPSLSEQRRNLGNQTVSSLLDFHAEQASRFTGLSVEFCRDMARYRLLRSIENARKAEKKS